MPIVDLVLPKLGESIMEATILKWHKKVGDTIQLDETLLDIATDKVDSEIPSTAEGIIVEILFEVNSVVPIGTIIAKIESKKAVQETTATILDATYEKIAPAETLSIEALTPTPIPYIPEQPQVSLKNELNKETLEGEAKFYSPLVMNIAQNEGVSMQELQTIQGTGAQGRVTKKDIIAYIEHKKFTGNHS
jgi:2-oxoglutarate dehydrogenase E2 component (dihydrolipoamide succinyltransferase)